MSKIEFIQKQSNIYNRKLKALKVFQTAILAGLFILPGVAYLLD